MPSLALKRTDPRFEWRRRLGRTELASEVPRIYNTKKKTMMGREGAGEDKAIIGKDYLLPVLRSYFIRQNNAIISSI